MDYAEQKERDDENNSEGSDGDEEFDNNADVMKFNDEQDEEDKDAEIIQNQHFDEAVELNDSDGQSVVTDDEKEDERSNPLELDENNRGYDDQFTTSEKKQHHINEFPISQARSESDEGGNEEDHHVKGQ